MNSLVDEFEEWCYKTGCRDERQPFAAASLDGRLVADSGRGITSTEYAVNDMPLAMHQGDNAVRFLYRADGAKLCRSVVSSLRGRTKVVNHYYVGPFQFTTNSTFRTPVLERVNLPWGYIDARGAMMTCVADYRGNIRAVVDAASGEAVQLTDYYPYGLPMATSTAPELNRYKYGGKEFETRRGLNLYDYIARPYDPIFGLFRLTDPKAGERQAVNPFLYCSANPVNRIDPTGMRDWPVAPVYNGGKRRHSNDYGEVRTVGNGPHQGVDINIGSGDNDLGAPVYATHDGVVVRVATVADDNNAGGNRVAIQSKDGYIETYYMHMETISAGLEVGDYIAEGQQIGTIGKSSGGMQQGNVGAHLHYEIKINGEKVNPADDYDGAELKDPQQLLDIHINNLVVPILPEVVVTPVRHIVAPPIQPPTNCYIPVNTPSVDTNNLQTN